MTEQKTKVLIGPVRISYAQVWKPKTTLSGKLKYSVQLHLNKKKDAALIKEVQRAIQAAYLLGKDSKFKGKSPKEIRDFKYPLRDGDKERDEAEVKGHFFINCSSDSAPDIVGKDKRPIIDEKEVYSGAICYVSVNFYAFNEGGGKGIAAGLGNIMKVADGKRLSGKPSAESDFADLEIEDEEDSFFDDGDDGEDSDDVGVSSFLK